MTERIIGKLEDMGRSVFICDHDACEAIYSKFEGRYHEGDDCPACEARDTQDDTDAAIIRAANAYGRK